MKNLTLILFLIFALNSYSQCWKEISCGWTYTVALKEDGTLWAWGQNTNGQLGDSTYNHSPYPKKIGNDSNWKSVKATPYSCVAIKKDGTLWTWGQNIYGQLGNGSNSPNDNIPRQVGTSNDWFEVFAGNGGHCFALKNNGALWGWGWNNSGQLGLGDTINRYFPVQIGNDNDWINVSNGQSFTLALKSTGTLWAFGNNTGGQLGNSSYTRSLTPIQIGNESNWLRISASYYTSHGIKTNGKLYAWGGDGGYGTLGIGSFGANYNSPQLIGNDQDWNQLESGTFHVIAKKNNGKLYSWGWNDNGQLGNNSYTKSHTPTLINNNIWGKIGAGQNFTICEANDSLYSWGGGLLYVLGDSNTGASNRTYPKSFIKYKCSVSNKYAYLTFSKTIAYSGDTVRITGFNFPSLYADSVKIYNSRYETQFKIPFTASATGSFQVYKIIASSEDGYNYVGAYDSVNKRNVTVERYEVIKTVTNPNNQYLQIYSPENIASFDLASNPKVNLLWKDKVYNASSVINKTATSGKKYTIEYQKNGGTWNLATTQSFIPTKGLMASWSYFNYQFSFSEIGNFKIRVKEFDNTNNWDTTATISVIDSRDTNIRVSLEWDRSGSVPFGIKPYAICADGTARVYIKVKKKTGYPYTISSVKLTCSDPNNINQTTPYIGKVLATNYSTVYDTTGNIANSTSSQNSTLGIDDAYWFWFVAPDNFFRSSIDYFKGERMINFDVEVNYSNKATETYKSSIRLFRPPVMLVHGFNSDEYAWSSFKFAAPNQDVLFQDATTIFKAGVKANNMIADALFIDNAYLLAGGNNTLRENSFQGQLFEQRNKGIACNRVDYICHSMGGCMIRSLINNFPNLYYAKGNSAIRNYNKGFTNKIITINTPHNGSVWANLLKEKADNFNFIDHSLLWDEYVLVNQLKSFFTPYDFNGFLGVPKFKETNAVLNLQSWNTAKQDGGVAFSETKNVRAAFIASNMLVNGSTASNVIDNLLNNNDPMMRVLYKLLKKKIPLISSALTFIDNIDNKFTSYGTPNFFTTSDLVVQLPSQLAGGNFNNLKPNEFLFNGSHHVNILSKLEVGNKCFELLNDNIFSNKFATSIPANPSPKVLKDRSGEDKPIDSVIEYFNDMTKFTISTIADEYKIDTNLIFTIDILDTAKLKKVNIILQGEQYEGANYKGLNSYSLKINSNKIDTQIFLVSLKYDSFGYDVYRNYVKKIKIIPYNNPLSLSSNPKIKQLNTAELYCPEILANHGAYISSLSLSNSDLIVKIADTNVIRYNKSLSKFYAKDTGTTYVEFEYKGLKDTMYYSIVPNLEYVNNGCIPPFSLFDLAVTKRSISTSNNSQNSDNYLWSFGDGTLSTEQNPTHTYAINGDYNVCLTSYNPCDSHKVCKTISVCDKPFVDFDLVVSSAEVTTTNSTTNATSYKWTYGDGQSDNSTSPKHTYTANGEYDICLTAYNSCDSATICKKAKIEGISSAISISNQFGIHIYPNPASTFLNIDFTKFNFSTLKIENLLGQVILTKNFSNQRNQINISNLPKGVYIIELSNPKGEKFSQKLTIE